MATTLTRFECYIPVYITGSPQDTAIQQFFSNMENLANCIQDTCYVNSSQGQQYSYRFYGFIQTSQQVTALGYLNTLNTALGTNIICTASSVTSEP